MPNAEKLDGIQAQVQLLSEHLERMRRELVETKATMAREILDLKAELESSGRAYRILWEQTHGDKPLEVRL